MEAATQKSNGYDVVNATWPEGTNAGRDLKPTGQEAISACKRLYRAFMGKAFKGEWKLTSGNRYTYPSGGVFYVNPNWRGTGGWHEVVHFMSHYVARRRYGAGHDHRHAFVEKEMVEYVVSRGWHLGALKKAEKPEPDPKAERYARVCANLEKWEAKKRRAETAIKKLKAKKRAYERRGVNSGAPN